MEKQVTFRNIYMYVYAHICIQQQVDLKIESMISKESGEGYTEGLEEEERGIQRVQRKREGYTEGLEEGDVVTTAHAGENEEQEHSLSAGRSANLYSNFENQYGTFSEIGKPIYLKTQLYHSWSYTQRTLHLTTTALALPCLQQLYL